MNSFTPKSAVRQGRGSSTLAGVTHPELPDAAHIMRSQFTRIIHLLLLLVVIHQLIGSELMRRPFPGNPPAWPNSLHEYVGLGSFAVVTAFWVWTMLRRGETHLARLIPWFSIVRLQDVIADLAAQLRRVARGQTPDDADGAFASAIHGLGLLAVTMMAVTGSVFFFMHGTPVAHSMLSLHKTIANLVWAYLVVHAGLAVLHHLLGSDIFSRMFWIKAHRHPTARWRHHGSR